MKIFYLILSLLALIVAIWSLMDAKKYDSTKLVMTGLSMLIMSSVWSVHSTIYSAIDKIETEEANRIIKCNYDGKYFNVMYTQDNKERALDGITPMELDSLINHLNK